MDAQTAQAALNLIQRVKVDVPEIPAVMKVIEQLNEIARPRKEPENKPVEVVPSKEATG